MTTLNLLFLYSFCLFSTTRAQSISTSTPVPPLQWINLTSLLQGSSAPPLKDASIGYDNSTRTLIIFGGESQGGLPQQQTYLLNLDTLVWSSPTPQGGTSALPPPRSAAVGGGDFAASYRSGHVIIGGKGSDGEPLSDVWEFDYNNQFWSHVNTSSSPATPALLGAVGGIDTNIPFNSSGSSGPTNTFLLMGGIRSSGSQLSPVPLSEVWQLDISGTLSSNLLNSLVGTWSKSAVGNNTAVSGEGGTVVKQQLVAFSGCIDTPSPNPSCAQPYSFVTDTSTGLSALPAPCAVPRIGAAVVANQNTFSSSFKSQVFVLLGLFNSSIWDDGGGLKKGEVDLLDINGGSWSRILPAGDPGKSGNVSFPQPRSGAASISYSSGLVGSSRALYSDTIIFGGQDGSGNYLSDMWILRAYGASVSQSGQQWSGFGNAQLQTGVDANGAGVTIQYMSTCANAIGTPPSVPSSASPSVHGSPTTSPSPSSTSGSSSATTYLFDTSVTHKSLAPISLALLLPTIILHRISLPSTSGPSSQQSIGPLYVSVLMLIVAYGTGLTALVSSFTSISSGAAIGRRAASSNMVLKTSHGQAGLALFVALYGIVPLLFFAYFIRWRLFASSPKEIVGKIRAERSRADSSDTAEKLNSFRGTADTGNQGGVRTRTPAPSPGHTPSRRYLGLWFRSREGLASSESATESESPVPRTFEVVNRRMRHHSASGTLNMYESVHRSPPTPRNLSDLSWLERRRSVNAVGDLDYALMQLNNRGITSTPATTARFSAQGLSDPPSSAKVQQPLVPSKGEVTLHVLMHILILALCIISLVELWNRAPIAPFVAFLVWTIAFYAFLVIMSWNGRPQHSALTVALGRIRGNLQPIAAPIATPNPSRPISMAGTDQFPFPQEPRSPYLHQPLFHAAEDTMSYAGLRSETEEIESDEDEDTRQRRIEDEMARRDVSIVTVPKRKLWVANPS